MKKLIICFLIVTLFYSCESATNSVNANNDLKYAELFSIIRSDSCVNIIVVNPWEKSQTLAKYTLVHRDSVVPSNLPEGKLVRIPVERVAVYAATDVGILSLLGVENKIKAACEPHFIKLPFLDEAVKNGDVIDIGVSSKPNMERLLMSNCDLVFTTPYKNSNYGPIAEVGIPLAQCANYMENNPLGRSEWVKFYAEFFDLQEKGDSLFNEIENAYTDIKQKTSYVQTRKSLLTEKKYGQTWWVPGGESYAAKIYDDAGADYIWGDDKSVGSLGLSFEEVFLKGSKAEFWFIRYFNPDRDMTLADLKSEYEPYSKFEAFKNKQIYGCNTALNSYYTFAISQPHIELEDIAVILYPDDFKGKKPTYYHKLN